MTRQIGSAFIGAAAILLWTASGFAQSIYPHSYSFSCSGTDGSGVPVSMAGVMQMNSATTAVGGTEFLKGVITEFSSFTATLTNGTATAQGSGGNSIPKGCFTGAASFGGDTFGVLNSFFGCYSETTHGFSLVQKTSSMGSGAELNCHGIEM